MGLRRKKLKTRLAGSQPVRVAGSRPQGPVGPPRFGAVREKGRGFSPSPPSATIQHAPQGRRITIIVTITKVITIISNPDRGMSPGCDACVSDAVWHAMCVSWICQHQIHPPQRQPHNHEVRRKLAAFGCRLRRPRGPCLGGAASDLSSFEPKVIVSTRSVLKITQVQHHVNDYPQALQPKRVFGLSHGTVPSKC